MADGTRVREPDEGPGTTAVDSTEVDFGAGDVRDRQRVRLAGAGPADDVTVTGGALETRVGNLPGSYPLPAGQATALTPQKDALTEAQLRAAPVDVQGGVNATMYFDNGTKVDGAHPLPVAGTFADENGVPFGTTNRLPVEIGANLSVTAEFNSVISVVNSRTEPLAANEVFVGQWEEVVNFAAIAASILTDQWSLPQGAVAQFSADGVDVIDQTAATIPPNQSAHFAFSPKARYFRIVYQNGPVAQALLEVEVTYRFNAPVTTQGMLDAPTYGNYVADLTQSALLARKDGPGEYANLRSTDNAELRVHDGNAAGRYAGGKTAYAGVLGAQGDTVVVTPAAGRSVRVSWVYAVTDPTSEVTPVITVRIGTRAIYSAFALSHWEPFTGAPDEAVTVHLSQAATVAVTVHYEEV